MEDLSVQRGIMAFDRASEVYAARHFPSRPLRFLVDLPVVEAVGNGDEIEAALPRVREMLTPGLIHLAEVDLYAPRPQWVLPFTREPSRDVLWSWPSQSPCCGLQTPLGTRGVPNMTKHVPNGRSLHPCEHPH